MSFVCGAIVVFEDGTPGIAPDCNGGGGGGFCWGCACGTNPGVTLCTGATVEGTIFVVILGGGGGGDTVGKMFVLTSGRVVFTWVMEGSVCVGDDVVTSVFSVLWK